MARCRFSYDFLIPFCSKLKVPLFYRIQVIFQKKNDILVVVYTIGATAAAVVSEKNFSPAGFFLL